MFTCWERADLLALVGGVYCIFVTFPCGILGQVWYLIVSIPDLCRLSYVKDQLSHGHSAILSTFIKRYHLSLISLFCLFLSGLGFTVHITESWLRPCNSMKYYKYVNSSILVKI